MKFIITALIALISINFATASSQDSNKAIYDALTVRAVNVNAGIEGSSRFVKSVGNLECEMATLIYPNAKPNYSCSLGQNNDAKAIYNAVNVKEVILNPGIAGVSRLAKTVGNLKCVVSKVIYPNAKPSYNCTLN